MKKVLIILSFFILSGCAYPIWGQQNGTFNNCYVNFLKPVYPTGAGLNIKNTLAPLNMFINDTSFVNYIIYWSKKGTHYLSFSDTTSIIATKADLGTLTLDSSKLITVYDVGNNFSGHVQNYFLNSPNFHSSLSIKNTGAIFNASGLTGSYSHLQIDTAGFAQFSATDYLGNSQSFYVYPSGAYYGLHKTVQDNGWVTDKYYTDSLVAAIPAPILDSSKLITKYDLSQPALYNQNYYLRPNLNNTLSLTPDYFDAYILGNNLTLTELRADTAANFRVECQNLNTGNHQFYLFDTTGLFYDTHKTDINPLWVPDRYYIDSLINTSLPSIFSISHGAAQWTSNLDTASLDIYNSDLITQNEIQMLAGSHGFNLNSFDLSGTGDQSQIGINPKQISIGVTWSGPSTGITIDSSGCTYFNRQTSQNQEWVPDKYYIDSVSTTLALDSSKLVTNYNAKTGLGFNALYASHNTAINDLWLVDKYYVDSLNSTITLDSSKLVTKYDLQTGVTGDVVLNQSMAGFPSHITMGGQTIDIESVSKLAPYTYSHISLDTTGYINLASNSGSDFVDVILEPKYFHYNSHQTVQQPTWIVDKSYIDSVATTLTLDSSKLVTNYNAQSGLGFNVLYASHQTTQNPLWVVDKTYVDSLVTATPPGSITSASNQTITTANITHSGNANVMTITLPSAGTYIISFNISLTGSGCTISSFDNCIASIMDVGISSYVNRVSTPIPAMTTYTGYISSVQSTFTYHVSSSEVIRIDLGLDSNPAAGNVVVTSGSPYGDNQISYVKIN